MEGSDSDYEEEESLVLVELSSTFEPDFLSRVKACKLLGVDTNEPLLQLDNYVYSGEYQDTMGTCLFLEDQTDKVEGLTETEEIKKQLEYKYKCNKKLCMKMSFLKPKVTEQSKVTESQVNQETTSSDKTSDLPESTEIQTGRSSDTPSGTGNEECLTQATPTMGGVTEKNGQEVNAPVQISEQYSDAENKMDTDENG